MSDVERALAQLHAAKVRVLHALAGEPGIAPAPVLDKQWIREEIACLLRVPAMNVAAQFATAAELVDRLPSTLRALADGQLTLRHAERLADAVAPLPDDAAAKVEETVLPKAASQSTTQFAASVRRAVARLDPRSVAQQRAHGMAQRRVVFTPQDNAMTELWADLPSEQAAAMRSRVCELAKQWVLMDAANGIVRTADQRRVDALMALVLDTGYSGLAHVVMPEADTDTDTDTTAGAAGEAAETTSASAGAGTGCRCGGVGPGAGSRPLVRITVALSTLLGLDEQPADLDGASPIPAEVARRLADDPTGVWRRLVTDSCGAVIDAANTYRPPARMAGTVRANWRTCCFPGCRRPAPTCELDHIQARTDGGPTSVANLQPLCARHHHCKHDANWQVRRLPDGTTRWTSPRGRVFDRPPDDPLPRDTTMAPRLTLRPTDLAAAPMTAA
ncbi:DUF222 domain-containing protein [uncultured Jatrophihabitans sp.]|uniref:HNH endonuclease signature motif containing protein n=1 Tax=uncultured Jatrophihabitans sp. TaxID=1610747 RepID=UPI0035CC23AC